MLQPKGEGREEHPDFKWGLKKAVGRTDKSVSFYESFTYEDIEYRLFDCAYFQIQGQCETSIGKLIRMYETSAGEKKVKVLWFFRPMDIRSYLRDYVPKWDELFLACGDDPGVYNINDVHTILGKCSVVCLSDDRRNPLPERRELRNARYVFSRTFDTKLKIISADFADAIAGIRVESFFNKRKIEDPPKRLNSSSAPVKSFRSESRLERNYDRDGKLTCRTSPFKKELLADRVHVKRYPPVRTDISSRGLKTKTRTTPFGSPLGPGSSDDNKPKRRKLVLNTPDSDYCPEPGEKKFTKDHPLVDKAPSQTIGRTSWYKKPNLCKQAFKERVDAKMIPASLFSNPHIGRALVIFYTKKAADNAISRLTRGCLMLDDERPLVGSRDFPKEFGDRRRFTGHQKVVDRALMSMSHCTQPNHIVHALAVEWKALHEKSEWKWKRLLEEQAKEMNIIFRRKNPKNV
ncbi:Nucleic acid binding protein [Hirschfeldia incana]|nr:Nucleic acid binding protein [Hirschfeldia incana]